MTRKTKTPRTPAQRITRARSALVIFQPFYGTLLMNLHMEESQQFPTMATDGQRVLWNPEFVSRLTDPELLFVLSHEAAHCANLHQCRRKGREPRLWNEAADYVINADLITAQIGQMPAKGLYDPQYAGLSTEDVYAMLKAEQDQQPQQPKGNPQPQQGQPQGQPQPGQPGQPGQGEASQAAGKPGEGDEGESEGQDTGQGSTPATEAPEASEGQPGPGTCGDPGDCGEILDAPGSAGEVAEEEAKWQTVTRQAINVATKAAGRIPAHLERLVTELGKPQSNWREHLRRFVDQSSHFDYSWQRPDRRFGHTDYVMPGTVSDGVHHVIIAIDTSGSINDKALGRFRTEAQSLLDQGAVDRITVIDCDAKVNGVYTFEAGDLITITNKGGGGTSFKPVWGWLTDHADDAAAVVYFTDLEPCDGFGKEPILPVLWAAYASPWEGPAALRQRMAKVPFGECIEVAE